MKAGIILVSIGVVLLAGGIITRMLDLPASFYTAGLGALLVGGVLIFVGLIRMLASRLK